jgi:hypothetical protein
MDDQVTLEYSHAKRIATSDPDPTSQRANLGALQVINCVERVERARQGTHFHHRKFGGIPNDEVDLAGADADVRRHDIEATIYEEPTGQQLPERTQGSPVS